MWTGNNLADLTMKAYPKTSKWDVPPVWVIDASPLHTPTLLHPLPLFSTVAGRGEAGGVGQPRRPRWRLLLAFTGCCCRCWCFPWRLCRWSPKTWPYSGSWGWRRRATHLAAAASSRWYDPVPSPPRSWWSCAGARSLWWLLRCKQNGGEEERSGHILVRRGLTVKRMGGSRLLTFTHTSPDLARVSFGLS